MKMLEVCNYPVRYKEQWNQYISFIEKNEKEYPFKDEYEVPDVISQIGSYAKPAFSFLITKSFIKSEEAYAFALESSLNNIKFSTTCFSNYEAAIKGAIDGELAANIILFHSLSDYIKNNKKVLFKHLAYDGAVLSPFDFNTPFDKDSINYCKYLLSTSDIVIALGVDWGNRIAIQNALDSGKDVYIHRSSLIDKSARELYSLGCPVINSIQEIPELYKIGTLYDNIKGKYKYLNKRYSFVKY